MPGIVPDTATNRTEQREPVRHVFVQPAVGQHGGLKGCLGSRTLPYYGVLNDRFGLAGMGLGR